MNLDADELFTEILNQATVIAKQVRPEHLAQPTPDTEWTVRDLLQHILYELCWVPDILAGKTLEEVGDKYAGELFTDANDFVIEWELASAAAEDAVGHADLDRIVHLSYGNRTAEKYLREAAADQLIHSWDLGEAIGVKVTFDPQIAMAVYDDLHDKDLQSSGLFAPPVDVPADADLQTKLLAYTGRPLDWREEGGDQV